MAPTIGIPGSLKDARLFGYNGIVATLVGERTQSDWPCWLEVAGMPGKCVVARLTIGNMAEGLLDELPSLCVLG